MKRGMGERKGGIGGGTGGSWAALSYASSREMVYSTKQVVEEDCGEDEWVTRQKQKSKLKESRKWIEKKWPMNEGQEALMPKPRHT